MKISKLVKRINNRFHHVTEYISSDRDETVWIGSQHGIYPLYGIPHLNTSEQILTLLDIPKVDHSKYNVEPLRQDSSDDINNALKASTDALNMVEKLETTITRGSNRYIVFGTPDGLQFIDTKDIDIAEPSEEYSYYYYNRLIVVKAGLLPVAVLCCTNPVDEAMLEDARAVFNIITEAFRCKQEAEKVHMEKSPQQMSFDQFENS
ncbi:MAG: hypothetical protein IJ723_01915 [Ruminococcus sp.]|nr:hypothetical protein [Ruminococcus sp.]